MTECDETSRCPTCGQEEPNGLQTLFEYMVRQAEIHKRKLARLKNWKTSDEESQGQSWREHRHDLRVRKQERYIKRWTDWAIALEDAMGVVNEAVAQAIKKLGEKCEGCDEHPNCEFNSEGEKHD